MARKVVRKVLGGWMSHGWLGGLGGIEEQSWVFNCFLIRLYQYTNVWMLLVVPCVAPCVT